jgi:hypothetical protein
MLNIHVSACGGVRIIGLGGEVEIFFFNKKVAVYACVLYGAGNSSF